MPNRASPQPLPEIGLLRGFLEIARSSSMSAAGAALGVSQPAITQQLQRLEAQIGQRLVHRKSRPLTLTAAGEALAQELPGLLEQLESLVARVRGTEGASREVLRMAMPDSLSCIIGAEFLSASGSLAQTVELRSGISPWIEEAFRARQFDLAVDSPPFDPSTRAECTPLFKDPYVLVSPRRLSGREPAEFVAEDHQVAYGRTSKFGAATAAIAQEMGAVERPRFSFDSSQSLLRFVQAGYGWAITSTFCLFQLPSALRDIDIHPCREDQVRTFFLLNRRDETHDLAGEAARRLIHVFRRLVDGPWAAVSPLATDMIRAANPGIFETTDA
ncbi:LysR family transcriptional regulator [Ostreiculturibacter nitratireducens]|uniref:LysR family transcriptional regulator n=1 Tax=Ostreiculturibacter nitratireducens TaxID=3075226 RepID=UPI0031B60145